MPRAMWKGAVQFGLVTIPVKLYLATESKGISFNLLHAPDESRIQMKIWCPVDEAVVTRSETVRGFEYAPGEYVVISDADLETVPLKTVRSIEIEQFTRPDRTAGNVRFVKQAYYLEPDKIARKAFGLLKRVLEEEGLTAICKVVIKDREALAALDPFGPTMLLTTLHWPDEIRSVGDLNLPDEELEVKPAELAMARQLVETMIGDFDPAQYRDEYRDALMEVIESKVSGHEPAAPVAADESGKLIDLMAALEASVKAATTARAAEAPVSVAEAKQAKQAKSSRAKAAREPKAVARAKTEAQSANANAGAETAEARPARKRRTA